MNVGQKTLRRAPTLILGLALITAGGSALAINFGDMMNPSKWMGGGKDRDYDEGRWGGPGYGAPGWGYSGPGWGYGAPGFGYGAPGYGYGAPGYGYGAPYGAPGYGYGGPGYGAGGPGYGAPADQGPPSRRPE